MTVIGAVSPTTNHDAQQPRRTVDQPGGLSLPTTVRAGKLATVEFGSMAVGQVARLWIPTRC